MSKHLFVLGLSSSNLAFSCTFISSSTILSISQMNYSQYAVVNFYALYLGYKFLTTSVSSWHFMSLFGLLDLFGASPTPTSKGMNTSATQFWLVNGRKFDRSSTFAWKFSSSFDVHIGF
jgi:hypothetical protein